MVLEKWVKKLEPRDPLVHLQMAYNTWTRSVSPPVRLWCHCPGGKGFPYRAFPEEGFPVARKKGSTSIGKR